jgi:cyclophilin family peptidyl-prolyl cis-trans isomerase
MIRQRIVISVVLTGLYLLAGCGGEQPEKDSPQSETVEVVLATSEGEIVLELYPAEAPVTVRNFLRYVDEGYYAGTVFHRVVQNEGFGVIQGGGFTKKMDRKPPLFGPIENEADNDLSNVVGTIAMARTTDPDSATSQFFINTRDNSMLDAQKDNPGYAVFGKVIEGMDVVQKIAGVETHSIGQGARQMRDVPVDPPMIVKARRRN